MKVNKKALIVATTFSVALNVHGCAYGPPTVDENVLQIEMKKSPSYVNEISSNTYVVKSNPEEVLKYE